MKHFLRHFIVSIGGMGYLKPASGTLASMAAAILAYVFYPSWPWEFRLTLVGAIFLIGWHLSNQVTRRIIDKDPYFIVIDEFAGMLFLLLFTPHAWQWYVGALLLFRLLDHRKIWPATYFNMMNGGFYVMFDDIIVAIQVVLIGIIICISINGGYTCYL